MPDIIFIDSEINPESGEILDLGAVSTDKHQLHTASRQQLSEFISDSAFIGGHNILAHDLQYLSESVDGIAEKQCIHYNNHAFDDYAEDVLVDETQYPEPPELILQLTHRDVFLDYFDNPGIKQMVLRHKSGDRLYLRGKLVFEQPDGAQIPIAVLSKSARERLDQLRQRGYRITDTRIRFIVARAREERGMESAVVLLDVELRRE